MSQALNFSRRLRVGGRMRSLTGRAASANPRRPPQRRKARKERHRKVARRQRKRCRRVLRPLPSPKTVKSRRLLLQARLRPLGKFFLGFGKQNRKIDTWCDCRIGEVEAKGRQ